MPLISEQDHCPNDRKSSEYLAQLLSDKKQLQIFPPKMFIHLEKILDDGKYTDILGMFYRSCNISDCSFFFKFSTGS